MKTFKLPAQPTAFILFLGVLSAAPILAAQSDSNLTFAKDIRPLFDRRCTMCHAAGGALPVWTDYATSFGKRAIILQRVTVIKDMPLGNASGMTDDERTQVAEWIQAGAPQGGDDPGPVPTPAPTATPVPPPVVQLGFADVKPIFERRCYTCHNTPDAAKPDWLVYDNAYRFQDLINRYVVGNRTMPPFNNMTGMTEDERATIGKWTQAGAPSGDLPPVAHGAVVTYTRDVMPIFGRRCSMCHSESSGDKVPNWLDYATAKKFSRLIYKRTVSDRPVPPNEISLGQTHEMPPNNISGITLEERNRVKSWIDGGSQR